MNQEYTYKPPIRYFFIGLGGIIASAVFGLATLSNVYWYAIIIAVYCLISLIMGITFLILYFRKLNAGNLKISEEFIEIPRKWKPKTRLKFSEIESLNNANDNVIKIQSRQGVYLIERSWMDKNEFIQLKEILHTYLGAT